MVSCRTFLLNLNGFLNMSRYVVCEYFPRGNVIGNFTQNVQACSGSNCSSSSSQSLASSIMFDTSFATTWRVWLLLGVGFLVML
jgi:hypothetical protein